MTLTKWWVDTSFAVHPDFSIHTGSGMSIRKLLVTSISKKQRINMKSSTESEVVGVADADPQILWTNYFIEDQGYNINQTVVYQGNQSLIFWKIMVSSP